MSLMSTSAPFLSHDQLLEVFTLTQMPTAIHVGEDAIIQTANDAMLKVWGKDRSVIGKTLEEALPELKGQPFIDMFRRVWNEGLTISGTDTAAELEVEGKIETYYFDFEYRAVKDDTGKTICILHMALDVTDRVLKKNALALAYKNEVALEREQAL
ncbi:MAG: PAS domain-containing sensor histidine kinase, partial [Pedobacter sp.]